MEDAGIKLSSVASDLLGVSGRAMLEALIGGKRDPRVLAELAKRRLRSKIPHLIEALTGRFEEHHAFMARLHLDLVDRLTAMIEALTALSKRSRSGAPTSEISVSPGCGRPSHESRTSTH